MLYTTEYAAFSPAVVHKVVYDCWRKHQTSTPEAGTPDGAVAAADAPHAAEVVVEPNVDSYKAALFFIDISGMVRVYQVLVGYGRVWYGYSTGGTV